MLDIFVFMCLWLCIGIICTTIIEIIESFRGKYTSDYEVIIVCFFFGPLVVPAYIWYRITE